MYRSAFGLLAALVSGLTFGPSGQAGEPVRAPARQAREVFQARCASCHGPGGSGKGGFSHVLDSARMILRNQVVPGDPDRSPLWERVAKGEMPPRKAGPLSAREREVIRQWIVRGAPALAGGPVGEAPASPAAVLRLVHEDLTRAAARGRRFLRYVSIAHLARAGLAAEEVERHRQALSRLCNSLSWHPRIHVPEPIDPAGTVFRIDLRWYRWEATAWERLALASPYRTAGAGPLFEACVRLAQSDHPLLPGDWLLATASRPPFYHDLLRLPDTDRTLERRLEVDVPRGIEEDTALRAGFNGSGVARRARLIERHDAAHGAYWRSYDFAGSSERQNIFEHPLGPRAAGSGFRHDGGEMIFSLPNGLHGYLLVDGAGRRIDRAPVEVVSDPARPDRQVETGISCMGCHVRGLIPKDDQVRARVLATPGRFADAERQAILALYVPHGQMRRRLDEDVGHFTDALRRAGVSAEEPEPVSACVRRYEDVLDLGVAAAEAGLAPRDLADRLGRHPELALALGALATRGGTVQRQLWEDTFPRLVELLRLDRHHAVPLPLSPTPALDSRGAGVTALAVSPDGKQVAGVGRDRIVRTWEVATGREVLRLEGHTEEVLALAIGGRRLVSGGRERVLWVWDLATGKEARRLVGHTDRVNAVALSADGRLALSAGQDRAVRVWSLEGKEPARVLAGHRAAVLSVALAPRGDLALSGDAAGELILWDLRGGEALARWQGHAGEVRAVAFSPDGKRLASGGSDRVVRVWDAGRVTPTRLLEGHANTILRVAFGPDGRHLLSAASQYRTPDPVVRVWDLDTGKVLASHPAPAREQVECAVFTPRADAVLLGSLADGLRRRALTPLPPSAAADPR